MTRLRKFAENTYVKLAAGIVLLITTSIELVEQFEAGIQAEHGILIFAIWHIVRVVPELQHAADELGTAAK